jgi:glycerol dehydrogenase
MDGFVFIAPQRYVQGPGVIDELGSLLEPFGRSAVVLASKGRLDALGGRLHEALSGRGIELSEVTFGGECTRGEIEGCAEQARRTGAQMIVGVGGGKTIDAAKAAAIEAGVKVAVVPTTASTDAPTASASLVYTEDGVLSEILIHKTRPDLVAVDSGVIADAPSRYLVSGMGDALATWFEARATHRSGGRTVAGGRPSEAALALARRCYEVVRDLGEQARDDVAEHRVTDAVEAVIEANTLLSGIGFESGGLAAAHAIHNGFTRLASSHKSLHGEKVAFATVAQLLLEGDEGEAAQVARLNKCLGLPVTYDEVLGGTPSAEELDVVAEAAVSPADSMKNMPREISAGDVVDALNGADALGRTL